MSGRENSISGRVEVRGVRRVRNGIVPEFKPRGPGGTKDLIEIEGDKGQPIGPLDLKDHRIARFQLCQGISQGGEVLQRIAFQRDDQVTRQEPFIRLGGLTIWRKRSGSSGRSATITLGVIGSAARIKEPYQLPRIASIQTQRVANAQGQDSFGWLRLEGGRACFGSLQNVFPQVRHL